MSSSNWDSYYGELNELLESMSDKGARWWNFSVSHRTFDLVVGDPFGEDNVCITMIACQRLCGPAIWAQQRLRVKPRTNAREVVLEDSAAGFSGEGHLRWRRNFDILAYGSAWMCRTSTMSLKLEEMTCEMSQALEAYYRGEMAFSELHGFVKGRLWSELQIMPSADLTSDPRTRATQDRVDGSEFSM